MKIGFKNSFFDSLERLNTHQTWWYKTYETLRYGIPRFFKNVWRFKNELYDFYGWDYSYNLSIFRRSLEITADYLEKNGMEVDDSRLKKVEKMRRAIELLNNIRSNSHIESAEKELGDLFLTDWEFEEVPDSNGSMRLIENETPEQKKHNSKVFARSNEIEEEEWTELWEIIKGQDHDAYKKHLNKAKISGNDTTDSWSEWFDGSGIRGWWD
jgi:hypothetical protein